jgi:hypothetical protein
MRDVALMGNKYLHDYASGVNHVARKPNVP